MKETGKKDSGKKETTAKKTGMKGVGISVIILGVVYFIANVLGDAAKAAENGASSLGLKDLSYASLEGLGIIVLGICVILLHNIRTEFSEKEKEKKNDEAAARRVRTVRGRTVKPGPRIGKTGKIS
ncbi:MAG: hypothetical protein IJM17_06435 [Firmicutes bacterium]|nr:hypothetical protein [Bacillota bacterium]